MYSQFMMHGQKNINYTNITLRLGNVLFKYVVITSVICKLVSMGQLCHIDRENSQCSEIKPSQCLSFHQIPHHDGPGTEAGTPR